MMEMEMEMEPIDSLWTATDLKKSACRSYNLSLRIKMKDENRINQIKMLCRDAQAKLKKALEINPSDVVAKFKLDCVEVHLALASGQYEQANVISANLKYPTEKDVRDAALKEAVLHGKNKQHPHLQYQQQQPHLQYQQQPHLQHQQQQPHLQHQQQRMMQLPYHQLQHGLSGGNGMHGSQLLSDQMFNVGATNPGNTIPTQQQQQQPHSTQGAAGNFVTGNSWSYNTASYECHGGEGRCFG